MSELDELKQRQRHLQHTRAEIDAEERELVARRIELTHKMGNALATLVDSDEYLNSYSELGQLSLFE